MYKWTKNITEVERLCQFLGLHILVLEKEGYNWKAQVRIRDGARGQCAWAETKTAALYWAMRNLPLDIDRTQQDWLAIVRL